MIALPDENATIAFAKVLAGQCHPPCVIYLQGDLGAGKTSLVRAFLLSLGYEGLVKSPTYTLVEHYDVNGIRIYHFDLYRLTEAEEIFDLDIADYCQDDAILFFEWPERAQSYLPDADLILQINSVNTERMIALDGNSITGKQIVEGILGIEKK